MSHQSEFHARDTFPVKVNGVHFTASRTGVHFTAGVRNTAQRQISMVIPIYCMSRPPALGT